jgi:hypothetical protein
MATCVTCFAKPTNQPEKDKEAIKGLFDGIPMDLRAKVKDNPVRCDRVNDWLHENVAGKGKIVGLTLSVAKVNPIRDKSGAYSIYLAVAPSSVNVLSDDWKVSFHDNGAFAREYQFTFEGVSTADAEKIADAKHVHFQGKVKYVSLARFPNPASNMRIVLEDILVDGKKWTSSGDGPGGPAFFGGKGKPFGGDDGGKTKKVKGK